MRKIAYILLLSVVYGLSGQVSKKEFKNASKYANASYLDGYYDEAYKNYSIMEEVLPEDPIIKFRLGVCERELFKFEESINSFDKSVELGYPGEDIYYQKGKTYQYAHDFDKAIEQYRVYIDSLKQDVEYYNYEEEKTKAQGHIDQCNLGVKLKENEYVIEISHLGDNVNSPYPDYAPLISRKEDVLIFTSRKPLSDKDKPDVTGHYHEHIYISKKVNGEWEKAGQIEEFKDYKNIASVALSPDGTHLILFAKNKILGHGLFMSELIGEGDSAKWSEPVNLGDEINKGSFEPSATISEDNQTIIFSSDREGGFGGMDLYQATKDSSGLWTNVKNLGDVVNTDKDEDSPFLQGEVLYFSSKGHETIGGYDLFTSVNLFDEWLEPINFGFPINSARDEIHFAWSMQGRRGYFSSTRTDTKGETDIYVIVRPTENPEQIYVKGTLTDEETNEPLANIHMMLKDSSGNVVDEYNTDSLGKYKLVANMGQTYNVEVESGQVESTNFAVVVPEQQAYFEVTNNVQAKSKPAPVVTDSSQYVASNDSDNAVENEATMAAANVMSFEMFEVYFGYNKTQIDSAHHGNLDDVVNYVNDNNVLVVLTGHTDKVGGYIFNDRLSLRRAKKVSVYLQSKGIAAENIRVVGVGKRKIKYDSDAKNRRVEVNLDAPNEQ